MSYLSKPIMKMSINDFTKLVNRVAKEDKEFAMDLVSDGLRGNVTPKFVRENADLGDAFEFSGELGRSGRKDLKGMIINQFKLPAGKKTDKMIKEMKIKDYMEMSLSQLRAGL